MKLSPANCHNSLSTAVLDFRSVTPMTWKTVLAVCGVFSMVLGSDGWVQGNGSRTWLPLKHHQFNIHCETSRVAHGASNYGRPWPLVTLWKEYFIEYNETQQNWSLRSCVHSQTMKTINNIQLLGPFKLIGIDFANRYVKVMVRTQTFSHSEEQDRLTGAVFSQIQLKYCKVMIEKMKFYHYNNKTSSSFVASLWEICLLGSAFIL